MSPALPELGLPSKPVRLGLRHTLPLAVVLIVALGFVVRYVLHYYLHYSESEFTNPLTGAPNYWRMRGWLLLHITGGMLALLLGPFQFSSSLRRRYLRIHRITGRIYVAAILLACIGAIRLAVGTSFERGFGFALGTLAAVWGSATLIALHAVLRGQLAMHREWMIRSYVLTFAFVGFRVLTYSPLFAWMPDTERSITGAWLCWSVPLFVTDMALRWRRLPSLQLSASGPT